MTRYKINIEYDGTNLIGWQSNQDGPSVQSLIQDAIYKFCGEHTEVFSAGRTDAGVHAICMTAHFDLDKEQDVNTIIRALNFYLVNEPVSVLDCEKVSNDLLCSINPPISRDPRYLVCPNQDDDPFW